MLRGRHSPAHSIGLLFTGAALLFGPLPGGKPQPRRKENTVSDIVGSVCFDKQWPIDDDGCLFFLGALGAGDLFRGMRRTDSSDGPIFRKGGRSYRYFPDEVPLLLIVTASRCRKDGTEYGPWRPAALDLLRSVHVEAAYIADLKLHPLEVGLAEQGTVDDPARLGTWAWEYRFVIQTKGVELRDPVIVWVLSRDGKKLAECPIRLAGPGQLWLTKSPVGGER